MSRPLSIALALLIAFATVGDASAARRFNFSPAKFFCDLAKSFCQTQRKRTHAKKVARKPRATSARAVAKAEPAPTTAPSAVVAITSLAPQPRSPPEAEQTLLIGNWRLPRHRRDKQAHVSEIFLERTEGLHLASHPTSGRTGCRRSSPLNRNLGALPMIGGNTAELLPTTSARSRPWSTTSTRPQTYVHVEFFILVHDETTAADLRRPGPGLPARRDGPGAVRPHRPVLATRTARRPSSVLREMGARVPADAAAPAVPRPLAAARPAQPPQARGDRRPRRLTPARRT